MPRPRRSLHPCRSPPLLGAHADPPKPRRDKANEKSAVRSAVYLKRRRHRRRWKGVRLATDLFDVVGRRVPRQRSWMLTGLELRACSERQ